MVQPLLQWGGTWYSCSCVVGPTRAEQQVCKKHLNQAFMVKPDAFFMKKQGDLLVPYVSGAAPAVPSFALPGQVAAATSIQSCCRPHLLAK